MRTIELQEMDCISGGWDVTIDFTFVKFEFSGEEIGAAYDWAVDKTADFFTWWDPMNYYEGRC